MRLSELYKRWTTLSPQQQKDVFGFFIGGPSMDLDGWTDAKERPAYEHALYVLHNLEEAFRYIRKDPSMLPKANKTSALDTNGPDLGKLHEFVLAPDNFGCCNKCGKEVVADEPHLPDFKTGYGYFCRFCVLEQLKSQTSCITRSTILDRRGCVIGVKHTFPDGIEVETSGVLSNDYALIAAEYVNAARLAKPPNLANEPDLDKSPAIFTEPEPIIDFTTCPGTPHIRGTTPKPTTAYQAPNHPPQVEVIPGALSTAGPDFSLIPGIALERLAERFQLGEERKGDKAWNAHSKNQHILLSKKFLIARLNHVIHHSFKLIHKLANDIPFDSDDDAAAIMWGGCFAIAATDAMTKEESPSKV